MTDNVTQWIEQLREGDSTAAEKLWKTYFQQMVQLAHRKLQGSRRALADEEDVALSAFKSFCLAAQQGRYSQLVDRSNLWPLLVSITANKSVDAIRRENRKKRGGTGAADASDAENRVARDSMPLSQIIASQPSPDFAAQVADEFAALLDQLDNIDDPNLKQITLLKLQGESNVSIASALGCARRTVERKLQVIEHLLRAQADDSGK